MRVYEATHGRLGNVLFRYLAAAVFRIIYGASRGRYGEPIDTHTAAASTIIKIDDEDFMEWWSHMIPFDDPSPQPPHFDENTIFIFHGYFQVDIYKYFRHRLIKHMSENQSDIIVGTTPAREQIVYSVRDLVVMPSLLSQKMAAADAGAYDIVVHIRLEDFLDDNISNVIHPETLDAVLRSCVSDGGVGGVGSDNKICFLCNKLTMSIEEMYMDYFRTRYNVFLESNDVITDYHIMKNARILVCSLSSLSWAAALLSTTVEKVYIPKNKGSSAQRFEAPIKNTILYENRMCGESGLREFFGIPPEIQMEQRENRENHAKRAAAAAAAAAKEAAEAVAIKHGSNSAAFAARPQPPPIPPPGAKGGAAIQNFYFT